MLLPPFKFSTFAPSACLLAWCLLVLATQQLAGIALWLGFVAVFALAAVSASSLFASLLRRTRWLLLALFAVFAWGTPGQMVWPQVAFGSPTLEGLDFAAEHAARLVMTLAWVALLLNNLGLSALVSGLYELTRPFSGIGLNPGRAALRLELTLRLCAQSPARSWRELMAPDWVMPPESVIITPRPWRAREWLLVGSALVGSICLGRLS